jgi:hypothetical protein
MPPDEGGGGRLVAPVNESAAPFAVAKRGTISHKSSAVMIEGGLVVWSVGMVFPRRASRPSSCQLSAEGRGDDTRLKK